jgi:repressor LexA
MSITKKQKEVYDYIVSYTEKKGMAPTQKEIKEKFELKSFGSVQRYIKYLTQAGYLATDWNARRGLKPTVIKPQASAKARSQIDQGFEIPLLGLVAAGNPIEAIENAQETVSVPPGLVGRSGRHFALRVQGDSMIEAGILENDLIVCRFQEVARTGEIVVALINGEATVKTYHPTKRGLELHPANHRLKPIVLDENSGDIRLAGVVVGLLRSYGPGF